MGLESSFNQHQIIHIAPRIVKNPPPNITPENESREFYKPIVLEATWVGGDIVKQKKN